MDTIAKHPQKPRRNIPLHSKAAGNIKSKFSFLTCTFHFKKTTFIVLREGKENIVSKKKV
jgi:hypothetical protein